MASSRCGAASPPWVLFPAAAPSWAAKTASVASASLSGTEPRAGGWRPLLPLPNTTWSLFGKEVSREGEGWEDLARNGSVLANQTRPLQGPGVLDCPDYLLRVRALPRWQWGAPLPTQPDSAHPLCMTPLGWEVSLPRLPDALLFFWAPHRIIRCIAGSRSPFPPSMTGTVQGEPGSSPRLVGIGKGNRIPLSFPLPRRRHPPPSVSFSSSSSFFPLHGVTRPGTSGKFL